jgi:phosphoglycerol transferase MdoB-like AlkP superfamily enzyme
MNTQRMMHNLGELFLLSGISVLMVTEGTFQWLYGMIMAILLLLLFTQDRLIGLFVAGWVGIFGVYLSVSGMSSTHVMEQKGFEAFALLGQESVLGVASFLVAVILFLKYRRKSEPERTLEHG